MKILITGGSSYIGKAIISTFKDFYFYALLNENPIIQSPNVKSFTDNELKACFKNNDIDLIIHLHPSPIEMMMKSIRRKFMIQIIIWERN